MSIKKGTLKCERVPSRSLVGIESHAYFLSQILMAPDISNLPGTRAAADWLFLAAGISEIVIATGGLGPTDDGMCPDSYERDREKIVSVVATELTRLLFVWGAVESLKRSVPGDGKTPRGMCHLLDAAEPELHHSDCAARLLLDYLNDYRFGEFETEATRSNDFESGLIGKATWAAYQVRNSLAHGSIVWPDDDIETAARGEAVASAACRVLLFATQRLALLRLPHDAMTTDLPNDQVEMRARRIAEVLPTIQLFG